MGHMVIVYPKVWQKLGGHVDVISLKSLHLVPLICVDRDISDFTYLHDDGCMLVLPPKLQLVGKV